MKLIKEIKSKEGELHFQRYSILSTSIFSIYIHKIWKADEDKHLHNHPWNIFTLILKGSYEEKLINNEKNMFKLTIREPGHFATRLKDSYHKINRVFSPVTTLAIVWGKRSDWGYWIDETKKHMDQESYRNWKRTLNN